MQRVVARMVEDHRARLPGERPQAPAHLLEVQPEGHGAPQEDHPRDRRRVEPLGDEVATRDDMQAPLAKTVQRRLPLRVGHVPVHGQCEVPRVRELPRHELRVLDVDAEADRGQRLPVGPEMAPVVLITSPTTVRATWHAAVRRCRSRRGAHGSPSRAPGARRARGSSGSRPSQARRWSGR